ncbi:hypothetical protein ACFLQ2_05670 [archaeon]
MKYEATAKLGNDEIKGKFSVMELLEKTEEMVKKHVEKEKSR